MRAVPGVVALAVTSDMPMFELSIACEIFGTDRSELADPWYELRLCAAQPGTTRTQNGFALHTPYDFHALTTADTVVVPAIPADAVLAGDTARMNVSGLPEALRAAHANGARISGTQRGDRPVPAPRPDRPRRRGRQSGRPAHGHTRSSARRAGAVHRGSGAPLRR
ncbi:hypothetical protein ACFYYP_15525 [Microbispora rosea]|uniref:hypothetical protein n=1 Tax=Microbispora rosea TaxID=58117 RepID=UPI003684BA94